MRAMYVAAALAASLLSMPVLAGPHGGPMWGAKHTPGWSMMSKEEREAHRAQMQGMTSHAECTAAMEKHHEQMMARAKERGITMPAMPHGRACEGMKDAPQKK